VLNQVIWMRRHGEVERLDARLASLARAEAGLRLRLGQVLEVMGQGKHFELGFSSLAAYALERCDRSVRWVEGARCLARRLEGLPEVRRALASGSMSWSMGELLARVADQEDEASWIEAAASRTVREMKVLVLEALGAQANARATVAMRGGVVDGVGSAERTVVGAGVLVERTAGVLAERSEGECMLAERPGGASVSTARPGAASVSTERPGGASVSTARPVKEGASSEGAVLPGSSASEPAQDVETDETCTLTCTVDQEEAWLFEATRALLEHLGVHGADAQVEALLAEAQGTLLAELPADALDLAGWDGVDAAQQGWLRELSRWRAEAEARCEEHFREAVVDNRNQPVNDVVAQAAALGLAALERVGSHELDGMLRGLSRLLAGHELELSPARVAISSRGGLAAPGVRERGPICPGAAGRVAFLPGGAAGAGCAARQFAARGRSSGSRADRGRGGRAGRARGDAGHAGGLGGAGRAAHPQTPARRSRGGADRGALVR
jgi:hypothetical protein